MILSDLGSEGQAICLLAYLSTTALPGQERRITSSSPISGLGST
jgi:hypothetical protein